MKDEAPALSHTENQHYHELPNHSIFCLRFGPGDAFVDGNTNREEEEEEEEDVVMEAINESQGLPSSTESAASSEWFTIEQFPRIEGTMSPFDVPVETLMTRRKKKGISWGELAVMDDEREHAFAPFGRRCESKASSSLPCLESHSSSLSSTQPVLPSPSSSPSPSPSSPPSSFSSLPAHTKHLANLFIDAMSHRVSHLPSALTLDQYCSYRQPNLYPPWFTSHVGIDYFSPLASSTSYEPIISSTISAENKLNTMNHCYARARDEDVSSSSCSSFHQSPVHPLNPVLTSLDMNARLGILFSGGLDSMLLASAAHLIVPLNQSIDLINVAFGEAPFRVPDRETGMILS